MQILYYIIFAAISWFLLMKIFSFSTYHKFFNRALVFLIGFSILNGYLLYYFEMHQFFLWHLPVFPIFFYINYKKQKKVGSDYEHLVDEQEGMTRNFFELSLE